MDDVVRAQIYTRKFPRVRLDIPVTQVAEHGPMEVVLVNVSASGALLVDPLIPVFGDARIRLVIRLPGYDDEVEASGVVVRDQEENGRRMVGVEFDEISAEDRALLVEFVKDRRGFT